MSFIGSLEVIIVGVTVTVLGFSLIGTPVVSAAMSVVLSTVVGVAVSTVVGMIPVVGIPEKYNRE